MAPQYKEAQTQCADTADNSTSCSISDAASSNTPTNTNTNTHHHEHTQSQSLYIIRHGDRYDYQHPEWKEETSPNYNPNIRKGDPSLSTLGFQQARQVGRYLDAIMTKENIAAEDITLLSSPFLRTIQTANELLSQMQMTQTRMRTNANTNTNTSTKNMHTCTCTSASEYVEIHLESSIWELDLWDQKWHQSLPNDMSERMHYFPRVNARSCCRHRHTSTSTSTSSSSSLPSSFIPSLPETPETFLDRCDRAIRCISDNYPYCPDSHFADGDDNNSGSECESDSDSESKCDSESNSIGGKHRVIILVTHAACCIGLSAKAAGLQLQDINAASPCSIYRLNRNMNMNMNMNMNKNIIDDVCKEEDGDSSNGGVSNGNNDMRWTLDHYSKVNGMNGYTGHMDMKVNAELGKTYPWNNFGDRSIDNGWTGPPRGGKGRE